MATLRQPPKATYHQKRGCALFFSLAGELCDLRVTSRLVLIGSTVSLPTPGILFYNVTTRCQRAEQSVRL